MFRIFSELPDKTWSHIYSTLPILLHCYKLKTYRRFRIHAWRKHFRNCRTWCCYTARPRRSIRNIAKPGMKEWTQPGLPTPPALTTSCSWCSSHMIDTQSHWLSQSFTRFSPSAAKKNRSKMGQWQQVVQNTVNIALCPIPCYCHLAKFNSMI